MKLELKKATITNAILQQVLVAGIIHIKTFDVQGWCRDKNGYKWIVLYSPLTNEIRKFLMFKTVELVQPQNPAEKPNVYVNHDQRVTNPHYPCNSLNDANSLIEWFKKLDFDAMRLGQFYL